MSLKKEKHNLIGQVLVKKGLITVEDLDKALAEQKKTKELLGEVLIRMGFLTDEMFYKILSEQIDVRYVKLKELTVSLLAISQIPARFACHYRMVPIQIHENVLTVAVAGEVSVHTLDELRLFLNKEIRVVLAGEEDIAHAIKKYYGVGADTMERMDSPRESAKLLSVQAQETQNIGKPSEDASIIQFVNQIFLEAYRERATDIHIEPYEHEVAVRYRIDGILYDTKVPPAIKGFHSAVVSRIKIMANLNIAETRLPQDGRIKVKIGETEIDLRVSVLPTLFGESVVVRLLATNVFFELEKLGLSPRNQQILENLIRKPHGILFVTGPTGSGKTTTLYASLSKINTKDKKIITIEDPIEYQLKGVTQVQVHPKINLTFAQALRSMLRHDPDVMMVGEVRDYETAEITIRVALTGHLVFSTIHTNDAAGGVTRLIDMGVEPFLVASSVECFIAQRLVRVPCPLCKTQVTADPQTLRELEVESSRTDFKIYQANGCDACKNTGYRGRTAIYEVLVMDGVIKELVLKRASSDQIRKKAMANGMKTLRQDGWEKVLQGMTTPSEVLRVTQKEGVMDSS